MRPDLRICGIEAGAEIKSGAIKELCYVFSEIMKSFLTLEKERGNQTKGGFTTPDRMRGNKLCDIL